MRHDQGKGALRLRLLSGSAALLAGVIAVGAATAQEDRPIASVDVVGQPPANYKIDALPLPKLTQPILDTPTIITTISQQVIEDRGDTSLSEVFRNASGISLGAGESSWQGTNLNLRGFSARNDIYLDGMRDFGSYYRDPFDLQEVDVLQGPSSLLFGRGSTGGVINQESKTPSLTPHLRGEATLGTDETERVTADLNEPIPGLEGAAFRLDLMGHESKVAGRDEGAFHRSGVAPSLALGLGTPTRFTVSYFHQSESDVPDYGIPWLLGKPAPVPRDSFYGFKSDYLHTDVNVETAKLEHDIAPGITLRTQLRNAQYDRHWRDTEPQPVTAGVTAATPLSDIVVNRAIQAGHSREAFLQDQTDLIANFNTGFIHHALVAGFEVGPESSKPEYDNATGVPKTTLLSPNVNQPFAGTIYPRVIVDTTAFTVAGYLIDTLKIGPQWEVTGGVRYDSFQSDYEAQNYSTTAGTFGRPTTHVSDDRTDAAPSYRAGVVYKPAPAGSLYFDYSTSFNPSAESLSEIVAVRSLNTGNLHLSPEKNRVFELGAKWALLGQRILLQGAIFREEKYNARVPDPLNPGFNTLGGDQRVDGVEFELVGRLTSRWQITASYTNLHSQVIKSAPGGPAVGIQLFNAPDNAFDLWTTYQLTPRLQVGGGVNAVSQRFGQNTAPIEIAPGYTTGDLMAKYQLTDRVKLQVNVFNVADAYYADQLHGFHIVPGPGRSALFSVGVDY